MSEPSIIGHELRRRERETAEYEARRATEPDGLLTDDEHRAVECAGQLADLLVRVTGYAHTRTADIAEALAHVHAIQNAVLAQAAARAYPGRYRTLGGTLHPHDVPDYRHDAGPRTRTTGDPR